MSKFKVNNVSPANCADQDRMIVLGLHPKRIINRPQDKKPFSKVSRIKYLKAQARSSFTDTKMFDNSLSNQDKMVIVKCHVLNVTGDNKFKTTYQIKCMKSDQNWLLNELTRQNLKVTKMFVNNKLVRKY